MSAENPIVQEVRARAEMISERYQHDLRKYAAHLIEVQRREQSRVVDQPRVTSTTPESHGRTNKPAA